MLRIKAPHRLTTQDASFLYGESRTWPLHFGGFATFAGAIEFDRLLEHIEARLPLVQRFRERMVLAPMGLTHPAMEPDPNFALTNHVHAHDLPVDCDDGAAMRAVMRVFEPPLSRKRPLWELHLFRGLSDGRSALLWKIHHAIVDGVSWAQILNIMLANAADEPAPACDHEPPPLGAARGTLAEAAADLVQMRLAAARKLAAGVPRAARAIGPVIRTAISAARPALAAPWNEGVVGGERMLARLRFPLDRAHAIQRAFGVTLNDVALAMLSEGAARYLGHHGRASDSATMRIGCPVSVRRPKEMGTLGNRVSMMVVECSGEAGDPVARLRAIGAETARHKVAHESEVMDLLITAADFVAPSLMAAISPLIASGVDAVSALAARAPALGRMLAAAAPAPINFIATNVRGPAGTRYVAGRPMLDYAGMIPLGGNLGYGVVICTYDHQLSIGLMADPRLMPDLELMESCIEEAFADLVIAAEAAGEQQPHPQAA